MSLIKSDYSTLKALLEDIKRKLATANCNITNLGVEQFGVSIDEGGVVSTGYKTRFRIPYDGTIVGWTMLEASETPITSTAVIDLKKGTYADYDTTPVFVSITGSETPNITNDVKGQGTPLTTWTSSVTAGDLFEWEVLSNDVGEKFLVFIDIQRT